MNKELVMFYNVENFFPPNQESMEQPNLGLRNWDEYKYNLKVRKITNVFRLIEGDNGQLPSIIGLAEIGAKSVLEDLTQENSPINDHEIIYQQSNDSRGLSVALLFDRHKYSLIQFKTLQFQWDENLEFDTRDILHVELLSDGKKIHVFVCHLPSKRNHDIKKNQRNYILEQMNNTIKELADNKESVILMGDFNENPDTDELRQLLYDKDGQSILSNPFEILFKGQEFSTYHGKKGVCFDQILFTKDHLIKQFNLKTITAEIYRNSKLRNKDNKNNKYPQRTYSGSRYIGGYSDHFPVILKLSEK